jgi:hypothetical protein
MDVNDGVISGQRGGAKSGQLRGWRFEAKSPLRAKGAFCFSASLAGWSGRHFAGFGIDSLAGRRFIVGGIPAFPPAALELFEPVAFAV